MAGYLYLLTQARSDMPWKVREITKRARIRCESSSALVVLRDQFFVQWIRRYGGNAQSLAFGIGNVITYVHDELCSALDPNLTDTTGVAIIFAH